MSQTILQKLPLTALAGLMALTIASAIGCGHDRRVARWNDRVLATGKLRDDQRLQQAERDYQRLLKSAPTRNARRYVLTELARISADRHQWQQALARYKRLYSADVDDEAGADALYQSGRIAGTELADIGRARRYWRRTIERYPASVAAEFAVRDFAGSYRKAQRMDALRRAIVGLHDARATTPIADNLLFELARSYDKRPDAPAVDRQRALVFYRRVYTEYPDRGLADESLWLSASIYRSRQQWPQAIALLETVADSVETSWFVGNYSSSWANDARFAMGRIELLHRNDYAAAIAAFEQYLVDFPHSLRADDAAWQIVEARRLMGQVSAYWQTLGDFLETYPDSRFVRVAQRRLSQRSQP